MIFPKDKIYAYFNGVFGLKKSSNGWWDFKCPMCAELENRRKMAVNLRYGWVKCWVCGWNDNVQHFVMEYEGVDYIAAKERVLNCQVINIRIEELEEALEKGHDQISEVELPYSYTPISEAKGLLGQRAVAYLQGRNFDIAELDRIGVGYCNQHYKKDLGEDEKVAETKDFYGYIVVPFKSKGKLTYYIGRDFMGQFLRYKNPPTSFVDVGKADVLFNEDALNIYGECQLLEGWSDACTIGRTAVSTQGWKISPRQRQIIVTSSCDRLVMLPDLCTEDGKGEDHYYRLAVEEALNFIDYKEVVVVDLSPLSHLGKDVNKMGKAPVMELMKKASPLTMSSAMEILLAKKKRSYVL